MREIIVALAAACLSASTLAVRKNGVSMARLKIALAPLRSGIEREK
jgi:hypothetical protein